MCTAKTCVFCGLVPPPPPSVVQGSDRSVSSRPAMRRGSVQWCFADLLSVQGQVTLGWPPPDTTWVGLKIEIESSLSRMNPTDNAK